MHPARCAADSPPSVANATLRGPPHTRTLGAFQPFHDALPHRPRMRLGLDGCCKRLKPSDIGHGSLAFVAKIRAPAQEPKLNAKGIGRLVTDRMSKIGTAKQGAQVVLSQLPSFVCERACKWASKSVGGRRVKTFAQVASFGSARKRKLVHTKLAVWDKMTRLPC